MNPLLLAVLAALLVPLVTRGSYRRLADASWELVAVLLVGLGLQVVLDLGLVPEDHWHDVGFGMLVASYVCIAGFCLVNLDRRGMGVVLVGVLANALVILVNQGMPVDVPQTWIDDGSYEDTVKHHAQRPDDTLLWLSDIIVLPAPFDTVISFGDIIVVVGIVDVVFHASRRPRRRRVRRQDTAASPSDDVDVVALLRVVDRHLAVLDASPVPRRPTEPSAPAAEPDRLVGVG